MNMICRLNGTNDDPSPVHVDAGFSHDNLLKGY